MTQIYIIHPEIPFSAKRRNYTLQCRIQEDPDFDLAKEILDFINNCEFRGRTNDAHLTRMLIDNRAAKIYLGFNIYKKTALRMLDKMLIASLRGAFFNNYPIPNPNLYIIVSDRHNVFAR